MSGDTGAYWKTRAERREQRRRNSSKMGVSGRSLQAVQLAIVKRAKGAR